jgi:hypothetical protein
MSQDNSARDLTLSPDSSLINFELFYLLRFSRRTVACAFISNYRYVPFQCFVSGFNHSIGSLDPELQSRSGSGSRREKMTHKTEKN